MGAGGGFNRRGRVKRGDYKGWGKKLRNLTSLRHLVIDAPLSDDDVLQFTCLTALNSNSEGLSDSIEQQLLSRMPGLKWFNSGLDLNIDW